MKVPFERETVFSPDWRGNMTLPEEERIRVTISWPTVLESSKLPDLKFETEPDPTDEDPKRTVTRATSESLSRFADAVLQQRVPKIENLEGITSGAELADAPEDIFAGLIWDIVVKYRAGQGALIEKKKD